MNQAVVTHRRNVQATAPAPGEIAPAGLTHRRGGAIRYTRGGPVYATDGLVGHIRNVVVDEETGSVSELVMDLRDGRCVVLPVDLVDHAAGAALFLGSNRAGFMETAKGAPEFEKRSFMKANLKRVLAATQGSSSNGTSRTVSRIGDDFVETPAPMPSSQAGETPMTEE